MAFNWNIDLPNLPNLVVLPNKEYYYKKIISTDLTRFYRNDISSYPQEQHKMFCYNKFVYQIFGFNLFDYNWWRLVQVLPKWLDNYKASCFKKKSRPES